MSMCIPHKRRPVVPRESSIVLARFQLIVDIPLVEEANLHAMTKYVVFSDIFQCLEPLTCQHQVKIMKDLVSKIWVSFVCECAARLP